MLVTELSKFHIEMLSSLVEMEQVRLTNLSDIELAQTMPPRKLMYHTVDEYRKILCQELFIIESKLKQVIQKNRPFIRVL